ncbi:CIC11C00000004030 [Sungouiella intermedia]|uniref:CIC11C00000004030 n=1 Tax=Sungouiella intermedia TaxID=45354 RepID=A0A1L0BMC6_9ASCO|nr:CIC11C00000004030 [[Candida] intermedia]
MIMHTRNVPALVALYKCVCRQDSVAMGLFNNIKKKIQDAEDKLVMKMTDDFYKDAKPETERDRKLKEHHLQKAAEHAHKTGQPATILENGQWYIYHPDGRKEPLGQAPEPEHVAAKSE